MKFKWPKNSGELKSITKKQLDWLLSGLKIEQERCFKEYEINAEKIAV